ncbi:MAG: tRNA lysidine(34) synthetase TilS [Clostridia bacterium]|nr:tRNA lysidine(34) synthetase TilS [Clostridia bacterium]
MKNPSKELFDRVRGWCASNGLFSPGDRVLCALSGGADSVALLLVLQSLEGELGIELSAAHVNHMLRGAEADRDEEFCRELCAGRKIPFTALRGDAAALAKELGTGTEDGARELRYSLLKSLGTDKIAVAHNSDDNLETVVMRLVRGGGARGLSGIPPKNGNVVRPVMCLSRAETEAVCALFGQNFVTDSSNAEDVYVRNMVRHRIVGPMKELNPNVSGVVLENSLRIRDEDAWLDGEARRLMEENGGMSADLFQKAGPVLSRRMIRIAAEQAGANPDGKAVERLLEMSLSGKSRFCYDVTGKRFFGEYGKFRFGEAADGEDFSFDLSALGTVDVGPWRITLGGVKEDTQNIYRIFKIFTLSSDKILGGLQVRSARSSDLFKRNEKSGTKKLKRIFSDMKLLREERENMPVLADGEGVLFVPVLGANAGREIQGCGEEITVVFYKSI